MGLWEATFGDLASAGIELTVQQREAVSTGGEVLVIQGLAEPGSFYCQCGMGHPALDQHGNVVMVAEMINAEPVTNDVIRRLDEQTDRWRFWPSYVGHRAGGVDAMGILDEYWDDQYLVRRVWSGFPVSQIGADCAERIIQACNSVVESTPWWMVDRAYGLLEEDGIPEDAPDETDDPYHEHRDFIEIRKSLRLEGWWDDSKNEPNESFTTQLAYPLMNEYLSQADHDVWQDLLISSRLNAQRAANTIRRGERAQYRNQESEFDPWF